jgi:peptidoglycan hydrolase-like protein with peptidoglycan-binding domain
VLTPEQQAFLREEKSIKLSEIKRDLYFDLAGEDVMLLQQYLILQNKGPAARKLKSLGKTTINFAHLTKAALAEYQKAVGISPAQGYFGDITKEHLRSIGF